MTDDKCRLCLRDNSKMQNVFSFVNGVQVSELTSMFFNIQIRADDNLSKKICCNCVRFLECIYTTRIISQRNQNILQKKIQKEKLKRNGLCQSTTNTAPIKINNCNNSNIDNNPNQTPVKYLRVQEKHLLQLCGAKVWLPRFNVQRNVETKLKKQIKHDKSKSKSKHCHSKKKALEKYYYNKRTRALRKLMTEKSKDLNHYSIRFYEDIDSYKILVENRKKLCSIERWCNNMEDTVEIQMERNIFMCSSCNQMFNTKWTLRIHEQQHQNKVIEDYEPSTRENSPLTIIGV